MEIRCTKCARPCTVVVDEHEFAQDTTIEDVAYCSLSHPFSMTNYRVVSPGGTPKTRGDVFHNRRVYQWALQQGR